MAARSAQRSNEGYPSSPSTDPHDPFGNAHAPNRYYDNDFDNADNYNRRDTYASEYSNSGYVDGERYYDHNGQYDPYG
jgi:1,3-beta-glucan synthase